MNFASASFLLAFAAIAAPVLSQDWCPTYSVRVIQATAPGPAGLEKPVQNYRNILGNVSNVNEPGPLDDGHRSVNWDAPIVPFDMPPNFFKATVTRGISFTTSGNEFRVSNHVDEDVEDNRFSSFDWRFPTIFKTFSPERLFASVWSNKIVARFFVPAQDDAATVSGFGAVFVNVKKPQTTFISYYDEDGCLIKKLYIKPRAKGLSFGGIKVLKKDGAWVDSAVYRVAMTLGDATISDPYNATKDVVVLDDLVYGEPQAVLSA